MVNLNEANGLQWQVLPYLRMLPKYTLFALAMIAPAFAAQSQNVNDPALLKRLLDGNLAARQKISTYEMTFTWTVETPTYKGPASPYADLVSNRIDRGKATMTVDGKRKHIALETAGGSKDGRYSQDHKHEAVLNDTYYGICLTPKGGMATCEQYDVGDLEKPSKEFLTQVSGGFWFDLLRYGFGSGDEYLQDAVLVFPDQIRWEVGKANAGNEDQLYKLTRFTPATKDPKQPDTEYFIDASAGYMITEVKSYDADGAKWLDIVVAAREVSPGVWFPKSIRDDRQGTLQVIDISSVDLAPSITPETFTWRGFHATKPSSAILAMHVKTDGSMETGHFVDGTLVKE